MVNDRGLFIAEYTLIDGPKEGEKITVDSEGEKIFHWAFGIKNQEAEKINIIYELNSETKQGKFQGRFKAINQDLN